MRQREAEAGAAEPPARTPVWPYINKEIEENAGATQDAIIIIRGPKHENPTYK